MLGGVRARIKCQGRLGCLAGSRLSRRRHDPCTWAQRHGSQRGARHANPTVCGLRQSVGCACDVPVVMTSCGDGTTRRTLGDCALVTLPRQSPPPLRPAPARTRAGRVRPAGHATRRGPRLSRRRHDLHHLRAQRLCEKPRVAAWCAAGAPYGVRLRQSVGCACRAPAVVKACGDDLTRRTLSDCALVTQPPPPPPPLRPAPVRTRAGPVRAAGRAGRRCSRRWRGRVRNAPAPPARASSGRRG